MTTTIEKTIKLENLLKYLSEDIGEDVKATILDYENSSIVIITQTNVNPLNASFDEEIGLVVLDDFNLDIVEEAHCILYADDFINKEMNEISLNGALNGCLVLSHLEQLDKDTLIELSTK